MFKIGILALQGDFAEHQRCLEACGAQTLLVKHAADLRDIDGLVIPGGESTTIAKLTERATDNIFDAITSRIRQGMPVYGTCMGSIFLAKNIEGSAQGRLALMDITVRRNAFGPQKFSREQELLMPEVGAEPFPAVFIRGPIITAAGPNVDVLATIEEGIVAAREKNMLVTAFHPELTDDLRVHQLFMDMVKRFSESRGAARSSDSGSRCQALAVVS